MGVGVQPGGEAAAVSHPPKISTRPVVVNDAGARPPSLRLREIWAYRELLYFLSWRDIKVRYKQTAMGAAWAIIQPLFIVLVFAVFFGLLVGVPTEGMPFVAFYYCGLLPWTFFANAVTLGSMSLIGNSNLITKVYFPRILMPAAAVGSLLIDLLIATAILVGLALYYGLGRTANVLMLPALLLLTVLLGLGLAVWVSALTVKYRDVRHVLPFALQLWMFVTPIIYPVAVVPEGWRWVMFFNPLAGVVEGLRASLTGAPFNWPALGFAAAATLLTLWGAARVFHRIERSFADLI